MAHFNFTVDTDPMANSIDGVAHLLRNRHHKKKYMTLMAPI